MRKLALVLVISSAPLLMAPSVMNKPQTADSQPPLICHWMPFLCR